MKASSDVRPASAQDAAACLAIYRPYVQNTAISWEIDVPTFGEIAARIDGLRATQEWLVLERDDQIIGFAYGQPLKRLAAFQWATETGMSTSPITSGRRTRALHATAALAHRTGLPARLRRHHPATAFIDPPGYAARDLLDTAGKDEPVGPTISSAAGGIRAAKNP
jgi:hypothetical protein